MVVISKGQGQAFQPRLIFVGKAKGLPSSEVAERYFSNIRHGWKSLPGTNTLAYYGH